jgi:hypothetical protein
MSGAEYGTGHGDNAEKDRSWPSPSEVVAVWAQATTQVLDIASSWWKTLAELGFLEEERLQSWSMTVFFPRSPHARFLAWSGLRTEAGEVVPATSLVIKPDTVSAGSGVEELQVMVQRPLTQTDHHYMLTIWDRNDPAFKRVYACAFGIPESET